MKPLYTEENYDIAQGSSLLPFECYCCNGTFYKPKKEIKYALKKKLNNCKYCSLKCRDKSRITLQKVVCKQCNKEFKRQPSDIKKSLNHFCGSSCSCTYQNTHKTKGIKRSKLEAWLETKLCVLYPDLEFHFNRKDAINSELDIYIPSLKLAFEINGIFHYEPIFGEGQLNKIQNNDHRKFQACIENGISLCIIDASTLKYFKDQNAQKYLDIIISIVKERLLTI